MNKKIQQLLLFLFLISSIGVSAQQHKKHEMRGVWIATVSNIDWPSRPGLMTYEQRNEMRTLLNQLAENKVNCIVLQIRPTADALYPSPYEPWSNWLSAKQGEKPKPFYDPLQFAIEEAHKRCIDVHVWLNPYRVLNSDNLDLLSKNHLYYRHKELFVKYGGRYYFDPGLDQTRRILNKVVEDIVERYDIDAIHFDDYFYPYPVAGEKFPDDSTFVRNPRGFEAHQKNDWRRNNVNMIIAELQQTIKGIKPWVEFGISPFGVWRNQANDPNGSATRAGIQNYDDLYADILKWLRESSIDYVVPQLYWEIGKEVADYKTLVRWWSRNSYGKNFYVGHYVSALGSNKAAAWNKPNEITRQMNLNLSYPEVDGSVFFSAKQFVRNLQGFNDSLKTHFYKYPALSPVNRNIKGQASEHPANLHVVRDGREQYLLWDPVEDEGGYKTRYYVIYAFRGKRVGDLNNPANIIARTSETCLDLSKQQPSLKGYYTFVVTSVNRYKHESIPTYAVTRKL